MASYNEIISSKNNDVKTFYPSVSDVLICMIDIWSCDNYDVSSARRETPKIFGLAKK